LLFNKHRPRAINRELRAHAGYGIAPVAIAGGSTDRPHLENIGHSGGEPLYAHRPRVGERTGGLPWPLSVVAANYRRMHFIALRMRNDRDVQHKFAAVAEAYAENRGIRKEDAHGLTDHGVL
jgi:hypothetical protein